MIWNGPHARCLERIRSGVCRNIQHRLLGRREMPNGAFRQIAQLHTSHVDAHETKHIRPDRREKAPDLAVPAFAQHHFEPSIACAGPQQP